MTEIADIQLKIKAVEFSLVAFTKYRNKEEEERMAFLESQLETVKYLPIYFDYTKDELKDEMITLQKMLLLKSFDDLLRCGISDFNPRVVARARRIFSSQMFLAIAEQNVDSAIQLYEQTLSLPQTTTEAMFRSEGYELNGPLHEGTSLIVCFKGTIPLLLKALTPQEITRCSSLYDVLKQSHANPYITSFEMFTHGMKTFMIMPSYPSSLDRVPKISVDNGIRLFEQIRSALDYLHSLNFNHMDIKPSNICLRESGDFVLIDLGSVVRKLDMSGSTVAYVPSDFQPRNKLFPNSRYQAVDINDWLMLGMTIAEKVYGLKVGLTAPPPTIAGLITILETDGAFQDLISLFQCTADSSQLLMNLFGVVNNFPSSSSIDTLHLS